MWGMLAKEVLRMCGTVACEHSREAMLDLCFYRDPEGVEKEEQVASERAMTKEAFQDGWAAPAPRFTVAQPEVADCSEGSCLLEPGALSCHWRLVFSPLGTGH